MHSMKDTLDSMWIIHDVNNVELCCVEQINIDATSAARRLLTHFSSTQKEREKRNEILNTTKWQMFCTENLPCHIIGYVAKFPRPQQCVQFCWLINLRFHRQTSAEFLFDLMIGNKNPSWARGLSNVVAEAKWFMSSRWTSERVFEELSRSNENDIRCANLSGIH